MSINLERGERGGRHQESTQKGRRERKLVSKNWFAGQRWIANFAIYVVQRVEHEVFTNDAAAIAESHQAQIETRASWQFRWLFIRFHGRWDTPNQRWPNMAGREGEGKCATAATTLRNCRCLRKQRRFSYSLENAGWKEVENWNYYRAEKERERERERLYATTLGFLCAHDIKAQSNLKRCSTAVRTICLPRRENVRSDSRVSQQRSATLWRCERFFYLSLSLLPLRFSPFWSLLQQRGW